MFYRELLLLLLLASCTPWAHLAALCVCCALDLPLALLGEADAEHAQSEAVCGLDVHVGLNQGLPLADHAAQLVSCVVHALRVSAAQHTGAADKTKAANTFAPRGRTTTAHNRDVGLCQGGFAPTAVCCKCQSVEVVRWAITHPSSEGFPFRRSHAAHQATPPT
jgi:hypothetical protein